MFPALKFGAADADVWSGMDWRQKSPMREWLRGGTLGTVPGMAVRVISGCVAVAALCGVVGAGASAASWRATADSPACAAAKQRIDYDNRMIARLRAQLPNKHADIQQVRARQINTQIARLRADLAKAQAAKAKECVPPISEYDGTYQGMFAQIEITFTVKDGVITGDLTNPPPIRALDAKTGVAFAQANFVDASCGGGVFQITFNAAAGTATAMNLKCTLGGQTVTQTVVARREG
jgi:hypothetical protein